jgi:hypothetical protein
MSSDKYKQDKEPSADGHLISASSFNEMVFSPKQEDIMLDVKQDQPDKSSGLQREVVKESCILNRKSARCLSKNQNLILSLYFALFAAFTWSRFY